MASIFNRNQNNNKVLEQIDWHDIADSSNNSVITNAVNDYTLVTGLVYNDKEQEALMKGDTQKSKELPAPKVSEGLWLMDIAQSHHYTVHISGMKMSRLQLPNKAYGEFLPVKTMNLKYTSYENMSIPVAIFGDFPLLNKKRVSTIDLSCYDYDTNELEYEIRKWESQCFPKGRFVAYMSDIAREFVYRGFNVKGQQTLEYRVYVIPAGNVSVSRDTSANEAKMVNFSLVCVGDGRTCATGDGKVPGVIVEDHTGAGDGRLPKGDFATLYASGYGQWNKRTQTFEL